MYTIEEEDQSTITNFLIRILDKAYPHTKDLNYERYAWI